MGRNNKINNLIYWNFPGTTFPSVLLYENHWPSRPILFSSMSLLMRELAFSMVQTATSRAVNPPAAEVLPMYPSTRTPASSNTLYRVTETSLLDGDVYRPTTKCPWQLYLSTSPSPEGNASSLWPQRQTAEWGELFF